MNNSWEDKIYKFIELCTNYKVRLIMVGDGAVNFHGYQRHSVDVDFWIDISLKKLKNLILVLKQSVMKLMIFQKMLKLKDKIYR